MEKISKGFLLLCFSLWYFPGFAQLTVKGTVKEQGTERALVKASITAVGSGKTALTDEKGRFELSVANLQDTLRITYLGYTDRLIPLQGRASVIVQLVPDASKLDEVVVVGYGSMKKGEVTSAIANVKSDEFVQGMVRSPTQLLQGKVAGLQMSNPSGDPTAGVQINIRGVSTISASSDPLVVIDGIPGGSLNAIAPEDVESIDVLKDGSAAAIYGTRGTNGVILVTTKKAKAGAASLDYHTYYSYEQLQKKPELLNATDYRSLLQDPQFADKVSDEGTSTDWVEEVTRTPINFVHNLSLRGGTASTNYMLSGTYRSQEGVLLRTYKKPIILKANINHNMWDDKLKFQFNISNSMVTQQVTWYDAFLQAMLSNPTRPVYAADGTYNEYGVSYKPYNPVALLNEETDKQRANTLLTSGRITYSPISNLNVSVMGGFQRYDDTRDKWNTFRYFTTTIENKNGEVTKWNNLHMDRTLELTADYVKDIGLHSITGMIGYNYQDFNRQGSSMYAFDFPTDYFEAWNIQSSNAILDGRAQLSSYRNNSKLISFFGRLTYNYADKYMVMTSLRREGSTKFGKDNKWGFFPAVSAGWRISKERFMENAKAIDDLKLRVGYGITGTEIGSAYQSLVLLNYTSPSFLNGEWIRGVIPASNPNPNLKWERKAEWNVGLDVSLLKSRISATLDLYDRTTSDLLAEYQVPVPPNYTSSMWANVGKINNRGVEISLTGKAVQREQFDLSLTGNFSYNKNKVVSLSNESYQRDYWYTGWTSSGIQQYTHIVKQGEPLGNFYGLKAVGLSEEGRWLVEALDGGQKLQSEAGQEDKQVLGNGLPKMYASLNVYMRYRKFDLGMMVRGAFDYQVFNEYRAHWETMGRISEGNLPKSALNKPFGSNSYVWEPQVYNSYFIEDGDFVKIDNITFGYNLNLNNKYFKRLRVYLSGLNLYTFTGYKGMDPEVSIKGLAPGVESKSLYPTVRSYTLGCMINL
ncbi:SusC/RagA family TonB-linked outer membrane protein [Olivibacter jilunii]|uniref:SusC/RagA family TonB-linked outer membrane protein n=1 Tax=Olivibacter jilunii TaxID=985016 RepID=UPI003F14E058